MDINMNNMWGNWAIQNMDDERFNWMSTWTDQPKSGLRESIIQAIKGELAIIRSQLATLSNSPYLTTGEQSGCLES